jgi:hypothetical protein
LGFSPSDEGIGLRVSFSKQRNVDDVKNSLAPIRKILMALAVIGCALSSVGAGVAHAQYYYHHHHYHHRVPYYHHHHQYYRYN